MDEKLLAKVRNVTIWAAGRQYAEVAINLPDIRGQGPRQYELSSILWHRSKD